MIKQLRKKIVFRILYVWSVVSTFWKLGVMKTHKRAFLFGCPMHPNMGDQAQTYCTLAWLKKYEPDYTVLAYPAYFLIKHHALLLRLIHRHINAEDKIYMHSGYHLTNLYMLEEEMNRRVLLLFPNQPIVFFPQTVYYTDSNEAETTKKAFEAHANTTLICRDEVSYTLAKELFPCRKLMLKPDIVTTLIGRLPLPHKKRNGILLCMRNDKESLIYGNEIEKLKTCLKKYGHVDSKDTTIDELGYVIMRNREKYLLEIIAIFASYRVVVTDRYHGTIFSLVANTPVIILPTKDHKLTSGIHWFPKEYEKYALGAKDAEEAVRVARSVLAAEYSYSLPDIFERQYYANLKAEIEGLDSRAL